MKPKIVCLCGSTKFYEEFMRTNSEETMKGNIVLSVGFFMHHDRTVKRTREALRLIERSRFSTSTDLRNIATVALADTPDTPGQAVGITEEQKEQLDALHKRKIDLCDEIIVLNVGGYISKSTMSEINYAAQIGRPIRYLETLDRQEIA